VRKCVAVLVATALLSISGSSALQHVHAYASHDHSEHHHGLAAHRHEAVAHHHESHDSEPSPAIEGCDPGAHAVSVVFTYVAPHADHALLPSAVEFLELASPRSGWRTTLPKDVRAHSPPRLTDTPLRAPPLVTPA
jgi:hypothetical protein